MKISVALAAYKGEKYIKEQLLSILSQLGEDDEIIVSDDLPSGLTRGAVAELTDSRIRYVEGPGKGVVKNFENALNHCTGDVIFLSDQDDVWLVNKVSTVIAEIEKGKDLVLHNAVITDGELNSLNETCFDMYHPDCSFTGNLIRNSYVGCCMAFRRELIQDCLPFPEKTPMHDWWIALLAIRKGYGISLIDEPLMLWRRHGGNVTGSGTSFGEKIRFRLDMISCLISYPKG